MEYFTESSYLINEFAMNSSNYPTSISSLLLFLIICLDCIGDSLFFEALVVKSPRINTGF